MVKDIQLLAIHRELLVKDRQLLIHLPVMDRQLLDKYMQFLVKDGYPAASNG